MKKIRLIFILVIVVIISSVIWYTSSLRPVSKKIEEKEIVIPIGTSTKGIAQILKENNIIRNKTSFIIYSKLHKNANFQAGKYYLKENMGVKQISEMLQTGIMHDPNQISITYLEGKSFTWLAKRIAETTNNTEEDVYNLVKNEEYLNRLIEKYWFITEDIKNQDIYYALEGYLFPDTYALKSKDVKVEEIFQKMLDEMESVLNKYRTEIESNNLTVHEILTIASIVETESIHTEDRKDVASVIYNRLLLNMAIQSDVTTYYAIKVDMGERDLKLSEINSNNPYNTRGPNMAGKLPVGPIASVSKSSIEAAINPNTTNYLFFVADKTGKVYFTKTNEEHNQIINKLKTEGLWFEY